MLCAHIGEVALILCSYHLLFIFYIFYEKVQVAKCAKCNSYSADLPKFGEILFECIIFQVFKYASNVIILML